LKKVDGAEKPITTRVRPGVPPSHYGIDLAWVIGVQFGAFISLHLNTLKKYIKRGLEIKRR
jgi:hypothetical protein